MTNSDSFRIDDGTKRVAINDDPNRVIVFNPSDVAFAERFYQLIRDFEVKRTEYKSRAEAIQSDDVPAGLALTREMCQYLRGRIDYLFGEGTSQKAFGDTLSLDAIGQFLDGITQFIQPVRAEKQEKYSPPGKKKQALK